MKFNHYATVCQKKRVITKYAKINARYHHHLRSCPSSFSKPMGAFSSSTPAPPFCNRKSVYSAFFEPPLSAAGFAANPSRAYVQIPEMATRMPAYSATVNCVVSKKGAALMIKTVFRIPMIVNWREQPLVKMQMTWRQHVDIQ